MTDAPPCAWCGEPSVREVEVEPAVYRFKPSPTTSKRTKVMARRAITARVCRAHGEMVDRERQAKADREAAERARRAKARAA